MKQATFRIAGVTLEAIAQPADLIAFADLLLVAVSKGLQLEHAEGLIYEEGERFALGELVQAARDAMQAVHE